MNKRYTLEAAEKLRGSELPILLAWAPGDRFFPLKYAERLAGEAAERRIVEIPDAEDLRPARPAAAPRRRDRRVRERRLTRGPRSQSEKTPVLGCFFATCMFFV